MSRIDVEALHAQSLDRMGDVLESLGAKVRGSAARGRATCPVHNGDGLNVAFRNGYATCHSACGGKTWDAVGLVSTVRGLDFRAACSELAAALNTVVPTTERPVPLQRMKPAYVPRVDAADLWDQLAPRDHEAETYLRDVRGLFEGDPDPDILRFNVGSTDDEWTNNRANDGYRAAVPLRGPDGGVKSISFRFTDGARLPQRGKVLSMWGCTTSGVAFCRPTVTELSAGSPEYATDMVHVAEGLTDFIAADYHAGLDVMEERKPFACVLGVPGISNIVPMLREFEPVIRGRLVRLALDNDAAGQGALIDAAEAARKAGASAVKKVVLRAKDFAEEIRRAA